LSYLFILFIILGLLSHLLSSKDFRTFSTCLKFVFVHALMHYPPLPRPIWTSTIMCIVSAPGSILFLSTSYRSIILNNQLSSYNWKLLLNEAIVTWLSHSLLVESSREPGNWCSLTLLTKPSRLTIEQKGKLLSINVNIIHVQSTLWPL